MPIADHLLSLALALNPQGGHTTAVTLGAEALGQPDGGASVVRVADVNVTHKATDASSKDPLKPQFVIKGNNHAEWIKASHVKKTAHAKTAIKKTESKTLEGYVTPGRKY